LIRKVKKKKKKKKEIKEKKNKKMCGVDSRTAKNRKLEMMGGFGGLWSDERDKFVGNLKNVD
jgi:hypothetical protein